ncbi:apoptosis-inducing factor 1, mitochondrial-like isoform X2 [Symsagittifera roscoffensis]|uniref:apoptosis-inducing factor 1, mitochondrial-like isoform X2 n=1 Tax=Symsagittifera roscoffensis TaxID=84072 RepID=UPI00307C2323
MWRRWRLSVGAISALSALAPIAATDSLRSLTHGNQITDSKSETTEDPNLDPDGKARLNLKKADFLIVGGGTAAFAAIKVLKDEADRNCVGNILMVTAEHHAPYMRPPLSKQLWSSSDDLKFTNFDGKRQSILYKDESFYSDHPDVELKCDESVVKIDAASKTAVLSSGEVIQFSKCLLATGACPKDLDLLNKHPSHIVRENHSVFRTVEDFKQLKAKLRPNSKVAVIGGGYLGCELSIALAALRDKNIEVVQIIPESGYMGLVLPEFLSKWIGSKVKSMGVKFREKTRLKSVNALFDESHAMELDLTNGEKVRADHVIVAIGVEPSTQLADSAGLEVDKKLGGFFVNSELESSAPDIWAAGDACSFYDTKMKCRRRVEHHDHAVVSGKLAAKNMLSSANSCNEKQGINNGNASKSPEAFHHQSMFWGDFGDSYGYEAIGLVDSKLPVKAYFKQGNSFVVVESGKEVQSDLDLSEGVLFYLDPSDREAKKIVGVVCWNMFGKIPFARNIVGENFSENDTDKLIKNFIV